MSIQLKGSDDSVYSNDIVAPNIPTQGQIVGYQQGDWNPTFVSTTVTGGALASSAFANTVWTRTGSIVTVYYDWKVGAGTPGNINVNDVWVFGGLPYSSQLFSCLSQGWTSGDWASGNRWFIQAFTSSPDQLKWGGSFTGSGTTVRASKTWYCSVQYITDDTTFVPINGATIS